MVAQSMSNAASALWHANASFEKGGDHLLKPALGLMQQRRDANDLWFWTDIHQGPRGQGIDANRSLSLCGRSEGGHITDPRAPIGKALAVSYKRIPAVNSLTHLCCSS